MFFSHVNGSPSLPFPLQINKNISCGEDEKKNLTGGKHEHFPKVLVQNTLVLLMFFLWSLQGDKKLNMLTTCRKGFPATSILKKKRVH